MLCRIVCGSASGRIMDDKTKTYLALAKECQRENSGLFEDMTRRLGHDVKRSYLSITRKVFADGEINSGRIVVVLAFALYVQERYDIDLVEETEAVIDECLRQRQRRDWLTFILSVLKNYIRAF